MKSLRKKELWSNFFWTIVGLSIAIKSFEYKVGTLRNPDPGFLPFWTGIFIVALSIYSMIRAWREKSAISSHFFSESGSMRRVLTTFLSITAYIFMVSKLGFMVSTFLLTGFLLKAIYPQSWLRTLLFSISVSLLSYLVFRHWLNVQLPRGWIGF
jgi:putative tricarboxylic transport membrane protein